MFDITRWWVIFPIIGLVLMLLMIPRMFGFWSRRDRRTGMGPMRMGPMGTIHDDHGQNSEQHEGAPEVLRGRYAAGELTDEEFDAKRRRLEGRHS